MADAAHKITDKIIAQTVKTLAKEYAAAHKGVSAKMASYLAGFAARDKKKWDDMVAGKLSMRQYNDWRMGQMAVGKRWEELRDRLAQDYVDTNMKARGLIQDRLPEVYATNHNYAAYQIENAGKLSTNFTLYDKSTVERLARENPKLYPDPVPGSKTARRIAENKDLRWNKKLIQSQLTQGILQGESIPKIAKRMEAVTGSNVATATRTARTAMTGAQNAGRIDVYHEAEDMGIELEKQWEATLDEHTRESHALMHGETVPIDEAFSNDLMYPGDPDGDPSEVYNCRCTMVTQIKGYEVGVVQHSAAMGDMTFEEWQESRKARPDLTTPPLDPAILIAPYEGSSDDEYNKLVTGLKNSGVDYAPVESLKEPDMEHEIIAALGGGDKTGGSCASVGLCYIGRKNGLDVKDFRGGSSQAFFSRSSNLYRLSKMEGVKTLKAEGASPCTVGNRLLKKCEEGKDYYLVAGRHASIVRREKGTLQYLELQSPRDNGWKDFGSKPRETLQRRFGCQTSNDYGISEKYDFMIDIEGSKFDTKEFRSLLGFINTEEGKELKGLGGQIR